MAGKAVLLCSMPPPRPGAWVLAIHAKQHRSQMLRQRNAQEFPAHFTHLSVPRVTTSTLLSVQLLMLLSFGIPGRVGTEAPNSKVTTVLKTIVCPGGAHTYATVMMRLGHLVNEGQLPSCTPRGSLLRLCASVPLSRC